MNDNPSRNVQIQTVLSLKVLELSVNIGALRAGLKGSAEQASTAAEEIARLTFERSVFEIALELMQHPLSNTQQNAFMKLAGAWAKTPADQRSRDVNSSSKLPLTKNVLDALARRKFVEKVTRLTAMRSVHVSIQPDGGSRVWLYRLTDQGLALIEFINRGLAG